MQTAFAQAQRRALILILCMAATGCALISGDREIPISEAAKDRMHDAAPSFPPILRNSEGQSMVFVAAFDGTLNDRLFVPDDESMTVIAKLYDAIDVSNASAGPISKHYEKGPGCRFGFSCWIDAMTGYSSEHTAMIALQELRNFIRDKSNQMELRVVVLGFSRGAATARHFLNLVQQENKNGFLHAAGIATWSTALLFDTVATGQEGTLKLGFPENLEFAVHYVAQNESRQLFSPILDNDVNFNVVALRNAYPDRRIWTIWVPGSHSDIGDSYLRGAGPLVVANAKAVLIQMGLVKPKPIDLCPDELKECRRLDEGLHDSRGLIDRLAGTPSPFSCGFLRNIDRIENEEIAELEAKLLIDRSRFRWEHNPAVSVLTSIHTQSTESYVMEGKLDSTSWLVVNPKWTGYEGYEAQVNNGANGSELILEDPINYGVKFPIPKIVFEELKRQGGKALIEFNILKPGGPWWFVNGCLPAE
ncbi:DUF2235 domain-containing protein [Rhodoferax sp. GW822-FHT02A01]|uniref:phospholipase effector Tle1 domain-containing protein n=1 Tax=Rhodoferax sp. GW822-FHT02A01 TaxID=3141537 RepID=UPI00315D8E18